MTEGKERLKKKGWEKMCHSGRHGRRDVENLSLGEKTNIQKREKKWGRTIKREKKRKGESVGGKVAEFFNFGTGRNREI